MGLRNQTVSQAQPPTDRLLEKKDIEQMGSGEILEELISALVQFKTLGLTLEKVGAQR